MKIKPGKVLKIYQHVLDISKNIFKYGYYINFIEIYQIIDCIGVSISLSKEVDNGEVIIDAYGLFVTENGYVLTNTTECKDTEQFNYKGSYLEFIESIDKTEEFLNTLPKKDIKAIRKIINKEYEND